MTPSMAMKRNPHDGTDWQGSVGRDNKMICSARNNVPVCCQSLPKTLFNYVYSYGEANNVANFECGECGADFMLLPVIQQARANHHVVEVAAHMGNQRAWTTPGVCRSEVNWVPLRTSQCV